MGVVETLEAWSGFGAAMAGVSGALAGLLIVAMSVNIEVIVASKSLPARAGASIATLVLTVIVSCLLLVPGATMLGYGVEVLVGTAIAWVFEGVATMRVLRFVDAASPSRPAVILVGALPLLAFTVGGVLLAAGVGGGMAGVVLGAALAITSSVLISWVTLVEVRR